MVRKPLEPPIYPQTPECRWFLVRHYVTRTREPALHLVRIQSRTSSNHPHQLMNGHP
jgi:hypothetical protein